MKVLMKRYPFYVGITTLVVTIVLIQSGLFLFVSHRESRTAAVQCVGRRPSCVECSTLAALNITEG